MAKFVKIFVGGLPRSIAEAELDELFSAYGDVHRTQLVRNRESGRGRGFGFVEMLDSQEAKRACDALHGAEIDGSRLTCNVADNSRPLPSPGPEACYRAVCVKNVPYAATEGDLRELFERIGPTHDIDLQVNARGVRTGVAFVTLGSAADAERALLLNGAVLLGRPLSVSL